MKTPRRKKKRTRATGPFVVDKSVIDELRAQIGEDPYAALAEMMGRAMESDELTELTELTDDDDGKPS